MQSDNLHLDADYKTYGYLKKLFIDIGHDVENAEFSVIEDFEKKKEQFKNRNKSNR